MPWQQATLNGAGREAFLPFFPSPQAKRNGLSGIPSNS